MKKIISFILSALMMISMFSFGAVVSAKTSVSATKITLSNVSKGVKITWKKAKGAKKYVLSRKVSGAKKYTVIKKFSSSKAKAYTDKKVKAGKKYTYVLKAVNGGTSATSPAKSIVRLKAPTNVKVKAVSDDFESYFKITWSKVKGAKGYKVYRSDYNGKKFGKYKYICSESTNSCEEWYYTESSAAGKYCKYKIMAYNGSSKSAMSAASSKIAMIDNVWLMELEMNDDYSGIRVSWDEVKGAEGYEIFRAGGKSTIFNSIVKGSDFSSKQDELGYTEYYYEDTNVTYGETYTYYVVAYSKYARSSAKSEDCIDSILCREYDLLLETGEDNANTFLSGFINLNESITEAACKVTSDDESIIKVETDTDTSGNKTLKLIGVKPGDTTVRLVYEYSYGSETETLEYMKFRIRVQDEPVYGAQLKAGESANLSASFTDLFGADLGESLKLLSDTLQITMTSEDESIVKPDGSSLIGVASGETKVRMVIDIKQGVINVKVIDFTFKVLVTD
ncbi:MAG: hypothetical protein IJT79_01140 [Ruminococcus sp.]|nr:hypothetical protein [Ruminococcus sp.]